MKSNTHRLRLAALLFAPVLLTAALCGSPDDDPVDDAGEPSPTIAAASAESPVAIATAVLGLTDTGYVALDGRPLFKECIQQGAVLPPVIPSPSVSEDIPATIVADPTKGATAPDAEAVPAFDPRIAEPLDFSNWVTYSSDCYGYALRVPDGWSLDVPLTQVGYQFGETGTMIAPDGKTSIIVYAFYTEAPEDTVLSVAEGGSQSSITISAPKKSTPNGQPATEHAYVVDPATSNTLYYGYTAKMRDHWYISLSAQVGSPHSDNLIAAIRSVFDSIEFR